MKMLWNLQLSAIDKNGKFLIDNDSNWSVCKNLIISLNELNAGIQHYIMIPKKSNKIEKIENVYFIKTKNVYTKNIFSSRYNWSCDEIKNIINKINPDFIFENNPTLVTNWKTVILELKKIDNIKVITYNHWIDSEKYPKIDRRCKYSLRQVEGIINCDLFFCNSKFAINQSIDAFLENYGYKHYKELVSKCFSLPPIVFPYNKIVKREYKGFNIIYNHRISSLHYYKDAYDLFIKLINNLSKLDLKEKINIHFTDASGKLSSRDEIPIKDTCNIKIYLHKKTKEEYYKLIKQMDLCVATFKNGNGGCWSISIAECIINNIASFIPNHSGYSEMVSKSYDVKDIVDVTLEILTLIKNKEELEELKKENYDFYMSHYSYDITANKFLQQINKLKA